ncbi:fip1[v]-like protein [Phtheirospermum japonicum]|uniref:Fip1[v]-like protein n=1 Tax=Phtheirospermum japonicum TaxID=374723 RepID=A0A830CY60_9LAMI|nr:fip1[v]-like protein [Phtheirospermum japonicum]
MEDDDEFGDLYTDVLRPLETSVQSRAGETDAPTSLRSRPIDSDVNSDDEEILYGASDLKNSISNSSSAPRIRLNPSIQEKALPEPRARSELGGFDLNLDSNSIPKVSRIVDCDDGLKSDATVSEKGKGVKLQEKRSSGGLDFMEEDDDLDIVVEERESKDADLIEEDDNCIDKRENMYSSAEQNENTDNYAGQGEVVGEMGSEQMIPGLSGKFENHGGSNHEDEWDSDESEDDLQIVLNDNNHGPMGMEMMAGVDDDDDDEDGDQLVIVADNGDVGHHHQQPMLEEQEWKGEELGPGADGERKELGDAAKASGVLPKVGYSNHLYNHHSFHSQFKYVRPGAAPLPGAVPVTPGGIQGQVRPPITMGPGAGRGRGDWRPRGSVPMQKGPHPGYGMPVWGPNAAGRGYGSGLDFTLPSHKTIFEVDIDGFEEKPWRLPGIDVSDFFNFGLNEDSWKDYCKQLEQLRLETTMQSKIRVYESGRTEQDYDPDLPPELAAAVGNQDIPSENANAGMSGAAGPLDLARASARVPPAAPIGRPIPVETGTGDRFPSADTRRPRMHDSDAIIEIVCQSSNDSMAELDNDLGGEDLGGLDDVDDLKRDDAECIDHFSHASNGQKREIVARRAQLVRHDETGREGDPHEARSTKGRGQIKSSNTNDSDDDDDDGENQSASFDSEDDKRNRPLSPSRAIESDGEQAVAVGDDVKDDSVMDYRSFDTEREDMDVDVTTSDALEDGKLRRPTNKQIVNDEGEDYKPARSSDNRSRSSKDEDKVVQDRQRPRSGSVKIPPLRDNGNNARRKSYHISGEGREDSHLQRGGALNSSLQHRHVKSENNTDWRKRVRVEDTRKREHGGEIGSRNRGRSERDDERHGSWVGANYDQDMGSRQRDRDDNLKNRSEKVDGVHGKRRKEGVYMSREHGEKEEIAYNHRESSSSRRKRERDDLAKLKDDDMSYVRQKEEGSLQKERGERQRDRDEWHRREREETRPVMRSGRPAEDKKWTSHSRGKDDYKGSGREYHSKNVGRHSDQVKRRERVEDDSFSQIRGNEDANARGNQGSGNDEKRTTYERPGTSDERDVYASDTSRLHEHRQKEGSRKGKEFESGEHSSLIPSKRNQDEQSGQISEMVNSKGRTEQANVENDTHASRQSSRKHGKEASSDDEQTTDSRRGRSKLERWTSHLERDFSSTKTLLSSSSKKSKHLDTYNSGEAPLPSKKVEDDKDASDETNNANAKAMEDNTHMDTVEKLKKRSERFKLPMPSEKEALAIKKIVNEPLPSSAQTENHPDSEIKPERPARKRRWTGN